MEKRRKSQIERFIIAKQDGEGRWQLVDIAQHLAGVGVACVLREGTEERDEVNRNIRYLVEERAAVEIFTDSGFRISRMNRK